MRFERVSFSYDDRTAVLSGGRSTSTRRARRPRRALGGRQEHVIALAARLWDPPEGRISLVDGEGVAHPLERIDDAELRRAVAVVEQDARSSGAPCARTSSAEPAIAPTKKLGAALAA